MNTGSRRSVDGLCVDGLNYAADLGLYYGSCQGLVHGAVADGVEGSAVVYKRHPSAVSAAERCRDSRILDGNQPVFRLGATHQAHDSEERLTCGGRVTIRLYGDTVTARRLVVVQHSQACL